MTTRSGSLIVHRLSHSVTALAAVLAASSLVVGKIGNCEKSSIRILIQPAFGNSCSTCVDRTQKRIAFFRIMLYVKIFKVFQPTGRSPALGWDNEFQY